MLDLKERINDFLISTIKLSHNMGSKKYPLLYETGVFHKNSGWRDLDMDRYATEEEARKGHDEMIKRVKAGEIAIPKVDVETPFKLFPDE